MGVSPIVRRYARRARESRHIRCCAIGDRARRSFARRLPEPATEKRGSVALVPLETLRDDISLRRVLHGVLTLSKLADRGRQLPPLRSTPPEHHAKIEVATLALLDVERRLAESSAHS